MNKDREMQDSKVRDGQVEDGQAQDAVEEREPARTDGTGKNPEGPHARKDLTDTTKTPGTGSLPDDAAREADVGPD